ncbi:MAG: hypothetical protein ABSG86_07655 [Thermoguttaceae bacterium]
MSVNTTTATVVAAIRAGAEVRSRLGQAATHTLLPDGTHKVQLYDRSAGRLLVGEGRTVAQAVASLRCEQGGRADG